MWVKSLPVFLVEFLNGFLYGLFARRDSFEFLDKFLGRFHARYPHGSDRLVNHVLLFGGERRIAAHSLMFPFLARNNKGRLAVLLASQPFIGFLIQWLLSQRLLCSSRLCLLTIVRRFTYRRRLLRSRCLCLCLDVDDYLIVDGDIAHAQGLVHIGPVNGCAYGQTCRVGNLVVDGVLAVVAQL